ncbi:uncharacterized protein LOC128211809 [Mya arenaria]|uniref:uncharacterized protein LOC128211809 n=1 Tax=Mya arenaria TaxID=6604 RepID=UPI0022E1CE3B|nr:uncharacterized protein LOC128211809 [Mya arenaria]
METSGVNYVFKCVIVGDSHVGKTTLLGRYMGEPSTSGRVSPASVSRQPFVQKLVHTRGGKTVELKIYDTLGQERYRSLTRSYFRDAQCCLVCFDVNNPSSFEHLIEWMNDINKYIGDNHESRTAKLIVGIARQTMSSYDVPNGLCPRTSVHYCQPVTHDRAELFATQYNVPYKFVNIHDDDDVAMCFEAVVEQKVQELDKEDACLTLGQDSVDLRPGRNGRQSSCC